jgi:hypothetical protein
LPPLVANFVRDADADRPMPLLGDGEARPDMIAYPLPTLALGCRSKDIESTLEVVRESVRNLDRLMFGMVRRVNTIDDRFEPSIVKLLCNSTMVYPGSTNSDP